MTETKRDELVDRACAIARGWAADMRARYVEEFGEDPGPDETGGWDDTAWGEAWKEIRREGGLDEAFGTAFVSRVPDDYATIYDAARAAFDKVFFDAD